MWYALFFLGIPVFAAALAAWGIWRRKWAACAPAVLIGVLPFLPAEPFALLDDIDDRVSAFMQHVEPRNLVMTWLLVDAAAVGSLVALWAGWSRRHWFGRLSALAAVPAALSLVRANEPIALSFAILPLITAAAWAMRRRSDRQTAAASAAIPGTTRLRWQIRDALLLFVVVGLIALAVRPLVAGPFFINWEHFATLSAALVLLGLTAAAAGGASSAVGRWLSAAACVGMIMAAAAIFIVRDNDVLGLAYFFEQPYIQDVHVGLFLMAMMGIPAAIGLVSSVYRWSDRAASAGQRARLPRTILLAANAALAAPLLIVGVMMRPPTIAATPLPPSPTYDRLVGAGERIQRLGYNGRTAAALKPEIEAIADILQQPGHVWFDAQKFAQTELSRQYDRSFGALQGVSIALEMETARAEARGDYSRSVKLAEQQFRLGKVTSHGGILMNWVLARKAECCGRAALDHAADHLSDAELRRLLAESQAHEQQRTPIESVIAYHDYWNWAAFGWRDRFFRAAMELAGTPNLWLGLDEKGLRAFERKEVASWRLLEARLAIELFRRDKNRPPQRLDQLVPDYLPQVPLDPWTGKPLIYRQVEDEFVLYCTGEDRVDNGGRFDGRPDQPGKQAGDAPWRIAGFDFDLGFERRDNFWPRDDLAILGAVPAAPAGSSTPGSASPASISPASPCPPAAENPDSLMPD